MIMIITNYRADLMSRALPRNAEYEEGIIIHQFPKHK